MICCAFLDSPQPQTINPKLHKVPIDKQNGLCKGYGFVRLSSEDVPWLQVMRTQSRNSLMPWILELGFYKV